MSDEPMSPEPPRLAGDEGETGRLLRSADTKFREKLDESGAFRSIERLRRRRVAMSWGALIASGLVAAFALSQRFASEQSRAEGATLTAEPLPPPPAAALAPPAPPEELPAARAVETPRAAPAPVRSAGIEHADEASCRKLVSAGNAERAVECFRTLARGDGIGAEVASYEAARISAEALRDAGRALRLLDEHDARFPSGALRGEVR
ncbi:MAG TPA: hypothetical protein VFZ53_14940, partial [Polyangiaceae bacterium]